MSNKEVKPKASPSRDSSFEKFDSNEFAFSNRLQLPQNLKQAIAAEDLDYRFLNAQEFRANGNSHQSHWRPYKPDAKLEIVTSAEGYITRGDLILGVREKKITSAHKKFLADRNRRYQGFNKEKAKELRQMAKDAGAEDLTKVHEGYEDNDGAE